MNFMGGNAPAMASLKLFYIVHDLGDPAVERRIRMLRRGGAEVIVAGFRRQGQAPACVAGAEAIDLGRTHDARMAERALAVLRRVALPGRLLAAARGSDAILGRNLEALAIALRLRRVAPQARLVYECLDIHRLLLGHGLAARMVQRAEAAMLGQVDLLLTSSPAFQRDYFAHRPGLAAPVLLLENKLLRIDAAPPVPLPPPDGPPWTIGWFGMLRCARTFDILSAFARRHSGAVRVLIAGKPSPAVFPDFAAQVAAAPHLEYQGPYRAEGLPALYGRCHYAWAIDYFEEGLNSRWLLPNRLYEAAAHGVVPIALQSVETGIWLRQHDAGLVLGDDLAGLDAVADGDAARYATLRAAVDRIPRRDLVATEADCLALVDRIRGAGR